MTNNHRSTAGKKLPAKTPPSRNSNISGAIRDVLVASLNKGQFPVALALGILNSHFLQNA